MLVLARQRDQTIMIGDDIEVTVVDVRGDKVRLGINAPRSVSVHRKEIWDAIRKENQASTNLKPEDLVPPTDEFMKAAVEEAKKGLSEGGLPIGSVLVRNGQVVARGHNRRVQKGDPMAHAEIDCLTEAGRQPTYKDTVLYSTLMPCFLCSGAVVQFGIPKVVVGESVNFDGAPDFMKKHGVQVVDLHDPECIKMMSDFIKAHPQLWNEDIGK
jgi:creatinine deaminase